jgi:hypothetical protein
MRTGAAPPCRSIRNEDTQVGLYRSILKDVELGDREVRDLM